MKSWIYDNFLKVIIIVFDPIRSNYFFALLRFYAWLLFPVKQLILTYTLDYHGSTLAFRWPLSKFGCYYNGHFSVFSGWGFAIAMGNKWMYCSGHIFIVSVVASWKSSIWHCPRPDRSSSRDSTANCNRQQQSHATRKTAGYSPWSRPYVFKS